MEFHRLSSEIFNLGVSLNTHFCLNTHFDQSGYRNNDFISKGGVFGPRNICFRFRLLEIRMYDNEEVQY